MDKIKIAHTGRENSGRYHEWRGRIIHIEYCIFFQADSPPIRYAEVNPEGTENRLFILYLDYVIYLKYGYKEERENQERTPGKGHIR